ncbi:hypothetical protein FQA39_LY16587 [Lamprigera yunnana]|nr:hypothetical protein FQA39_LY16587 [Lamprigera yunnana]
MGMAYAEQGWTKAVDLRTVVERLHDQFSAFEFDAEHEAVHGLEKAYAKKQLTGRAKMIVSTKIITSWAQLKEFLIETFSPRQSIDELILESQTCRQLPNESIIDFTLRLDILDSKFIKAINLENNDSKILPGLLKMKDNICLRAFLAGVLPVYQNLLSLKEPSNYQEASYFCLKIENENKINQSHERLLKKPNSCNFCKKNNHTTANCYKKLNHSINPKYNENQFVKSEAKIHNIIPDNHPHFQTNIPNRTRMFCNYCKKSNHEIKDCRRLKWKREQENRNANTSSNVQLVCTSMNLDVPICTSMNLDVPSTSQSHLNSQSTVETSANPQEVNLVKAEYFH